jgi:hypothetical protein
MDSIIRNARKRVLVITNRGEKHDNNNQKKTTY